MFRVCFALGAIISGITFVHHGNPTPEKYLVETMGGGLALIDYNNDGLLDIFFVNGGKFVQESGAIRIDRSQPEYWNRLYRNNGDGTFTDVTLQAGVSGKESTSYGMGVTVGDYDNDGYPDLYITNFGQNVLYHNNGNGTFTDVTKQAGVAGGGWSVSAGFLDYNNDGRLDLFIGRYLDWDFSKHVVCGDNSIHTYCPPAKHAPATNLLYRNDGNGHFTDVSAVSGIAAKPGTAMGVSINDYDGDGFPDIFVSNDGKPHFLYHNERNGTFREVGVDAGVAYDENGAAVSGMGADFADYDNDGRPDIVVTDLAKECFQLYRNLGNGVFASASRTSHLTALSALRSGWGVRLADYDNDGWKDLLVAESHAIDNIKLVDPQLVYKQPPQLFRNNGGKFVEMPLLDEPLAARGLAMGDLFDTGKLELVVAVLNGTPKVIRNDSPAHNHWLGVKLIGTKSNRDGQGVSAILTTKVGKQWAYATTCGSYLSAQDGRLHFGLGGEQSATLELKWPSGKVQNVTVSSVDKYITVSEP